MISSFTFKQDNTHADEPMVDLLKYLNSMLDAAMMQARLPSGYNPLQQLVLIISDGRFSERVLLISFFDFSSKTKKHALQIGNHHPQKIYHKELLSFPTQDKLKRRVRDILSTKRMVAFLLLDNPDDSMMDLMVKPTTSIDSFFLLIFVKYLHDHDCRSIHLQRMVK